MWAKPFKPPTMRGMSGGRPQPKKQEDEEVMVIEATPSPPGSPKTSSSKTSLTAPSTSPTKENEVIDLEDEDDQAWRKNWKPKKKLLFIDHQPTEKSPVKETLAQSRQGVNAKMKPLVSRADLKERLKEEEVVETATGPEGYFRVLW